MAKITKEQLLAVEVDGEPLHDCDLTSHAALGAAKVLAGNWEDATRDGEEINALVNDVDDVIAMLRDWKVAVLRKFPG